MNIRTTGALAGLVLAVGAASAHEAPAGWQYGFECCSAADCYQAPNDDVKESRVGYELSTGEVIPYGDYRIKRSRDEFFHECKPAGDPKQPRSLCLYVPDRGF